MSQTEDLDAFVVRTRHDSLRLLAALSRRSVPGTDWVLAMTRDRSLEVVLPLPRGERLPAVVDLISQIALPGEALLLVSDRTGETPADRPDDELIWEEMRGTAAANDVVLLDWYVLWGTTSFSVAEFAPTPAQW